MGCTLARPDDIDVSHQVGRRRVGSGETRQKPEVKAVDLDPLCASMVRLHPAASSAPRWSGERPIVALRQVPPIDSHGIDAALEAIDALTQMPYSLAPTQG
jgi:hypothetical protein